MPIGPSVSAAGASRYLADVKRAVGACKSFTAQGETTSIAKLSVPKLGDDTVAFRITSRGVVLDDVFVKVGSTVLGFGYGGPSAVDTAQTERYAKLATRKLQQVG